MPRKRPDLDDSIRDMSDDDGCDISTGSSVLTIPVLLNEAQKSLGHGQVRYASVLWTRVEENLEDELHQLCVCLKWIVSLSERNMYHDRLVKFFGVLASLAANADRIQCIDVMLRFLVEWSRAKEPIMRWRTAQIIGNLVNNMPEDADLPDEALDEVQLSMFRLLEDGRPNVRAAAVRSLLRLPQPNDDEDFDDCEVVNNLLDVLSKDKSKEVRKAVISVLPVTKYTVPFLVARTRDESDDVRKTAFLILAEKTTIDTMDQSLVARVICKGLSDRVPSVVEAAEALVTSWFDSSGGEPLTLLKSMNAIEHVEAAELALKALFTTERLNAVHVALLASNEKLGLRTDFRIDNPNLMTTEEAIFWRCVCIYLSSEASSHGLRAATSAGATANVEAATAGERLEAFEEVMPSSLDDLAFIIDLHGGKEETCAQLLLLAAQCADFADASGRKSVGTVTHSILATKPYNQSLFDACFQVIGKLYVSDEEIQEAAFQTLEMILGNADLLPLDPQKMHALTCKDQSVLLSVISGYLSLLRNISHDVDGISWSDVFMHVILPSTTTPDVFVRALAYKCMGLYCLVESDSIRCSTILRDMFTQLTSLDEDPKVKAVLAQALGDSCLLRGPKVVQSLIQDSVGADDDESPTIIDALVHYAQEWIESDDPEAFAEFGEAIVEALIKMVSVNEFRAGADEMHHTQTALEDGDMIRIIVKLFILCFDSCTVSSPKARQSMLVFFQRYATMSVTCQQYLATAMLPSARTAASLDAAMKRKTVASGAISPQVIKFASQLLQMPVLDREGNKELFGHEPLAEIIMGEIIKCAGLSSVPKQYLNAMCKVPASLPMYDASEETRETVSRVHLYALHAAKLLTDPVSSKELETIQRTYSCSGGDETTYHDESMEQLLHELKDNVEAFCCGFPEPFDGQSICDDEDSGDDSSFSVHADSRPAGRRMPARATRATANMNEISDDEESPQVTIKEEEPDDFEDQQENMASRRKASKRTTRRQSSQSVAALGEALHAAHIA